MLLWLPGSIKRGVKPHHDKARPVGSYKVGALNEADKGNLAICQVPGKEQRKPKFDHDPKQSGKNMPRTESKSLYEEREYRHLDALQRGVDKKYEGAERIRKSFENADGVNQLMKTDEMGEESR